MKTFLESLGFKRCPRMKCGEYNILRCASEEGHKGECCFAVYADYTG